MDQSPTNATPPYYAVVFTSRRTADDPTGYEAATARMLQLAATMPGYLGVESARGDDGQGITVSYWETAESIRNWQQNAEHLAVQSLGRERWYQHYALRVCRVEREVLFDKP